MEFIDGLHENCCHFFGRNMDIEIKDNIYFGDVIKTGAQTNLQILFDDETVFTIGENTEIVINEFIYDPNQSNELNTISEFCKWFWMKIFIHCYIQATQDGNRVQDAIHMEATAASYHIVC